MIIGKIRRATRRNNEVPRGKCFVSFSYDDEAAVDRLQEKLAGRADLFKFPPIQVPPEEMVSNELLRSIRRCHSLIYLIGGESSMSPWVTLERDYALRSGLNVYYFDQKNGLIGRDKSIPLDLKIHATYQRNDSAQVYYIVDFMRRERSFEISMDLDRIEAGSDIHEQMKKKIITILEGGGYFALFWSKAAASRESIYAEMQSALEHYPERIVPALLEPIELPASLTEVLPVKLYKKNGKGLDLQRVDDLIVRLYWQIQSDSD